MANKFFVGGTGNSNDQAHWSDTDGGPGGATLPTSGDDVFFTALSSGASYTCHWNATFNCRNLNVVAPATGNVTFDDNATVTIAGGLDVYAGAIWTHTGLLSFTSTTAQNISTNDVSMAAAATFSGAAGTWTLQSHFRIAGALTHTRGSLVFNGFNCRAGRYSSSNANVRALNLTNSLFSLTAAGNSTIWETTTTTNLTLTTTNSTVELISTANTNQAITFPCLVRFGGITLNNLTLGGVGYAHLHFESMCTVSGAFLPQGTNANIGRLRVSSDVKGTARTFTLNGTAVPLNVDFEDITCGGTAAPISGTSVGDCGGNSGITFTAGITLFWVGNSGDFSDTNHWSLTDGGAAGARMPLPQDTARFTANSFSIAAQSVTFTLHLHRLPSIDATGVTNAPIWNCGRIVFVYGHFDISAFGSLTGVQEVLLAGRGAFNLFMDKSCLNDWSIEAPGGTYTLTGAFSNNTGSLPNFNLRMGHFNAATFDLHIGFCTPSGTLTRTLSMGSGTWYINASGIQWNLVTTTNLTFNRGTSTIEMKGGNTNGIVTFRGGGLTYYNFRINKVGTGAARIEGSNTFNIFSRISSVVSPVEFLAGQTTTVTDWQVSGTAGNLIIITTSTAANHNLVKAGGGVISANFLNISRSQASPGTTWYAGTGSTDGGNNSGWIFTAPPVTNKRVQVYVLPTFN